MQLRVRPWNLTSTNMKRQDFYYSLTLRNTVVFDALVQFKSYLDVSKDDLFGHKISTKFARNGFYFSRCLEMRGNAANPDDRKQSVPRNAAQRDLRSGNSTGRHYLPYRDCRPCKRAKAGINKMEVCQHHVQPGDLSGALWKRWRDITVWNRRLDRAKRSFIVAFVWKIKLATRFPNRSLNIDLRPLLTVNNLTPAILQSISELWNFPAESFGLAPEDLPSFRFFFSTARVPYLL